MRNPLSLFSVALILLTTACPEVEKTDTAPADTDPPEAVDADGDGYTSTEDCDDEDPSVYPGAPESCDGVDNDCDELVDDEDPDAQDSSWYLDKDGDGFGTDTQTIQACEAPSDYADQNGDCDDSDAGIHPDAEELTCDGVDQDCDGLEDDTPDADGDGFGICDETPDCDDLDATAYPGAEEFCDGVDNDCDGTLPEVELDEDGDGIMVCEDDCDDLNATVYPGAAELCDGVDNDCDGTLPVDELDEDGDGVMVCEDDCDDLDAAVYPGAAELCDGVDNDCDSSTLGTYGGCSDGNELDFAVTYSEGTILLVSVCGSLDSFAAGEWYAVCGEAEDSWYDNGSYSMLADFDTMDTVVTSSAGTDLCSTTVSCSSGTCDGALEFELSMEIGSLTPAEGSQAYVEVDSPGSGAYAAFELLNSED